MKKIFIYIVLGLSLVVFVSGKANALEGVTNGDFGSDISTGWSAVTYVQQDTGALEYDGSDGDPAAGSLKGYATGRKQDMEGYIEQIIAADINSDDTVELSLKWKKVSVTVTPETSTITVKIEKPSNPGTWVDIWSDSTTADSSWAAVTDLDVSSNFDDVTPTGYKIRLYIYTKTGNDGSAEASAWIDSVSLALPGGASSNIFFGTTF